MKQVFLDIAEDIRVTSINYPTKNERFTCTTRHGDKLSCINSPEAIDAMVERYEKAAKRNPIKPPVTRSPDPSLSFQDAMNRFIESGEILNTIEFAKLKGKPIYFYKIKDASPGILKSARLLDDERFVVGKTHVDWSVTHLDSGFKVNSGKSKKEVLKGYCDVKHKLTDAVLKPASCDFQQVSLDSYINGET